MSRRVVVVLLSLLTVLLFSARTAGAVSAPTFKPVSPAKVIDSVTVTLASATKDATIVYTVDGSDPKKSSTARTYKGPLTLDRTTTISANAKLNKDWSGASFGTYTITVPSPSITPSSRAFMQNVSVRIKNIHPLTDTIRYTLDGTVPTSKSTLYVDLGVPLLTLTKSTVLKAKAFRSGATESATTEMRYPRVVVLLLHGLNSDPGTPWKALVSTLVPNDHRNIDTVCPRVSSATASVLSSTCYRADFGSKTVNGVTWSNGDGEQFSEYASDINGMIDNIVRSAHPQAIILVGHSRGGLAARAFLQKHVWSQLTFGLLTVGTPHQGSPLGRIYPFYESNSQHKLTSTEFVAWQKKQTQLRFVFAPSTAALATDHDAKGKPISSAVSAAISNLNTRVSSMSKSAKVFGQVNSTGLDLGVDLGPFATNLLADVWLKKMATDGLLPGPFDPRLIALRAYVLKNLTTEWNRGDGAVPEASADLSRIFTGSVITTKLTSKRHTALSEETVAINRLLESLTEAMNKDSNWSKSGSSATVATLSVAADHVSVQALREEVASEHDARAIADALTERVARGDRVVLSELREVMAAGDAGEAAYAVTVVARAGTRDAAAALLDLLRVAPDSDAANMARSELLTFGSFTRQEEREAVSGLLLNRLILPVSANDRAVLMTAIARIGTLGGVRTLLHEYEAADELQRVAITDALASVRAEDATKLLAEHLSRAGDPLAEISGETLSQMVSPRATAVLLRWARQTLDTEMAVRWLARVRDAESLRMVQQSVENDAYLSLDVQSRIADVVAEIDRQSTPLVPETSGRDTVRPQQLP
jgi:hypothetical protein